MASSQQQLATRPLGPAAIRAALAALPQKTPQRPRDLAARIGISEAALIAATAGPAGTNAALRLRDEPLAILRRLPALGRVLALTRNQAAVHEKVGSYGALEGDEVVAGIYGEAIDLRLFLRHWRYGFAFNDGADETAAPRRSLQFFDAQGDAVHKVHLRAESDHGAFAQLVAEFASGRWDEELAIAPAPAPVQQEAPIDVTGLRVAWTELQNVHDFHLLLRRFKIERLRALELVGREHAYPVAPRAHRELCAAAAASGLALMLFVSSAGCVQIHSGPIHELKAMGPWWNIQDPGFNLHLREDAIGSAWVVKKPTELGVITSLEIFDHDRQLVLSLFGQRAKGQRENPAWRALLADLPLFDHP